MSLNNKPYIIRSTLIDSNPVELKHNPFMINPDKFTGSCNALSPKICAPSKTKNINSKAFNMVTNKNEVKQ